jgi:hypothetical protein
MFHNDAAWVFWVVPVIAVALLLLASLRSDARYTREQRTRDERAQLMGQSVADSGRQRRTVHVVKVPEPAEDPAIAETRHWCALGLNKLGYSMVAAREIANKAPCDQGLEQAIQWCLRNSGGTRK